MTISITISDATNLTDAERNLLRCVLIVDADRRDTPTGDWRDMKAHIERMAKSGDAELTPDQGIERFGRFAFEFAEAAEEARVRAETERHHLQAEQAADLAAAPVEPPEVYSPHTQVINTAAVFGVQPPAAPAASAAPAAPAAPETDSRGLPWDARIHSETRNKNKDGSWRNKRGVSPEVLAAVEAELRGVPAAPVASVPTPPAPPAPTGDALTFRDFMQRITPKLVSGQLAQAALAECVARHGLASLPELAQRPELIPVMLTELGV